MPPLNVFADIVIGAELKVREGWTFSWKAGTVEAIHSEHGVIQFDSQYDFLYWIFGMTATSQLRRNQHETQSNSTK